MLYNMPLGAEHEAAWIGDCVRYLRERGLGAIEPTLDAEKNWDQEVAELANATLYPLTDSWYTGANIPGKPRQFCVHLGGPLYFQRLAEVAAQGYEGFVLEKERRAEVVAASELAENHRGHTVSIGFRMSTCTRGSETFRDHGAAAILARQQ